MCFPCRESSRPFFPSLPHLSRFYRVLKNAQALLARLSPKAQAFSRS
nr:hypothetical protein [Thermus oshimai]